MTGLRKITNIEEHTTNRLLHPIPQCTHAPYHTRDLHVRRRPTWKRYLNVGVLHQNGGDDHGTEVDADIVGTVKKDTVGGGMYVGGVYPHVFNVQRGFLEGGRDVGEVKGENAEAGEQQQGGEGLGVRVRKVGEEKP